MLSALVNAEHHGTEPERKAPGWGNLEFVLPEPGSYALPEFGVARDSDVVTSENRRLGLHKILAGKFSLLSFIYTNCSDVNGCSLATYVLARVQDRILADAALRDYVRLVSYSFDPRNDSPQVLARYAEKFRKPGFDWTFVTAVDDQALTRVLQDYDQFVIRDYDEQGNEAGSISHLLRVYLIDQHQKIRNIYSVSFLHPDTVINDIRTIVATSNAKGDL